MVPVGVQGLGEVGEWAAAVDAAGLHDGEDAFDKAAACCAVAAEVAAPPEYRQRRRPVNPVRASRGGIVVRRRATPWAEGGINERNTSGGGRLVSGGAAG